VPLLFAHSTVTIVRHHLSTLAFAMVVVSTNFGAFPAAELPPVYNAHATPHAQQDGPVRATQVESGDYWEYSPYDATNERTDARYDVQYVYVGEFDTSPTSYYIYLHFAEPVSQSQFSDGRGSWAGVLLDTDLDGITDIKLGTAGQPLPTSTASVAGSGPAGCAVRVFSNIGEGAKYLGFKVEKTCLGLGATFGVQGYADYGADDDAGYDYAPEKFWRFTKPGGPVTTNPPPAWTVADGKDRPDDRKGYQVHVVYVATPSATNFGMITDGSIERWVGEAQEWLRAKVGSGLLYDTHQGRLDVSFLRVDHHIAMRGSTKEGFRDESDLRALYRSINKESYRGKTILFVVDQLADPGDYCGYARSPGDYALIFPQVPDCGVTFPFHAALNDGLSAPASALVHELFHSYGVPHVCVDATDLMIGSPECPDARDREKPSTLDVSRSLYVGGSGAGVDVTTLRIWEDGRGARRPGLGQAGTCWAGESCLLETPSFTKSHRLQLQVRKGNRWTTVFTYKGALDSASTGRYRWKYAVSFAFASPGNVTYRLYVPPSGRFAAYVGPAKSVFVLP
jgi:hypothetical protein